jgi:hypothetical protein
LFAAIEMLDKLPVAILEALRDYVLENYQLPRSPIEGENRDDADRFAGSLSGSHGLLPLKLGIVGPSGAFRTQ